MKCQSLLLFAGIFLVQRRALGPISVSGKEQAQLLKVQLNLIYVLLALETGSPSDKLRMRPGAGCGQKQAEEKNKVLLL